MRMPYKLIFTIIVGLIPIITFSQIPTVFAICGEGQDVNWPEIKAEAEKLNDPYFYNDCDQGVKPLRASSTLSKQGKKSFGIKNINDDEPMTAWVEGNSDYGIGEYFEIKAPIINVIYNGYQSSPTNWLENSRVKKFKVYKNNVPLCFLVLKDEMGRQTFELPGHLKYNPDKEFIYKFEIVDVYKGSKWKDVAISEINLGLCCFSENTIIETPTEDVNVTNLQEGNTIYSINLETGELTNTEVLKVSKQRHLSMINIICETKELKLTSDHPLYIKNYGFCSISRYMALNKISNYEDLIDNIEFGIWNKTTGLINFEKLKNIKIITGDFETYTIGKLTRGKTFISNGFISRTY
jgi:hypothetical protein